MKNVNKKYFYLGIALLFIIIIIVLFFAFKNKKLTYETITATDDSFSIKLPSNISYQINQDKNNDFVIDLYSKKDEMFFYATRIEKSRKIDLHQIVEDDKKHYLEDKQNIQEDSGIIPCNINNYKSYEYKFTYSDTSYGKVFYSNVVWIETSKNLYVLNFEVVNDNTQKYQDIFFNMKNSFVEL